MKLARAFTGKMDLDSNDRYVQIGDYRLLENGIIDQDGSSSRYVVKNLKSTTEVKDLSISGYKCIGGKVYKGIIYAFYNNGTLTRLYSIDTKSSYASSLLFSFDLGNTQSSKIVDIDFVENLEASEIYLYWNDKENQPFKVNVDKTSTHYSSASDMYVVKAPPSAPNIYPYNDDNLKTNRFEGKCFVFAASFEYEDGELSSTSQFSTAAVETSPTFETVEYVDRVVNLLNAVNVEVDTGSKYVRRINVYAKDQSSSTTFLIETIDKDIDSSIADNSTHIVSFKNDASNTVVDSEYTNMLYSNVPLLANAQSVIGNRLLYGDYTSGYDLDVEPDFQVEEVLSTIASTTNTISGAANPISGRDYDFALYEAKMPYGSSISVDLSYVDSSATNQSYTLSFIANSFYYGISNIAEAINVKIQDDGIASDELFCTISGTKLTFLAPYGWVNPIANMTYVEAKGRNTLKSGEVYKESIIYFDDYDRIFRIPPPQQLQISNAWDRKDGSPSSHNADLAIAKSKITISHLPPTGAVKYAILRSRNIYSYESFQTDETYSTGTPTSYRYIRIPDSDVPRVSSDSYRVERYADSSGLTPTELVEEIISIDTYDADEVFAGSSAGTYIKIADVTVAAGDVFYAYSAETANTDYYSVVSPVYDIIGGYHQGDVNQAAGVDAEITTDDHDVFVVDNSSMNYREVYKLSNGIQYYPEGKSYVYSPRFKKNRYYSSITWSDAYVDDIDYNGLSTYNPSTYNYVDLYKEFGAITGLDEHIGRLLVIQEDKWGVIELNRSITSTATGVQSINKTDDFLLREAWNPFNGDYGSYNYRGFAKFGNTKYAPDKKRKAILRLSTDGLTEISDYNMISYFNDMVDDDEQNNYIGAYNAANNEYWLYDIDTTNIIIFDEKLNGWTRLITPLTADHMLDYAGIVYTFEDDKIHTHMTGSDYGSIHGGQKTFKLKYVENKENATPKVHNAIELESNRGLATSVSDAIASSQMAAVDYEDREGEYFTYIPNTGSAVNDDILETNMIVPMGEVGSNDVTYLTMKDELPRTIRTKDDTSDVGDNVYYDASGTLTKIGEIVSIDGLVVEVDWVSIPMVDFFKDKFVFAVENSYLNARNIRGNTVEVELTDATPNYLEINAVNIEVTQSNNE